jgi:hypothetical protein
LLRCLRFSYWNSAEGIQAVRLVLPSIAVTRIFGPTVGSASPFPEAQMLRRVGPACLLTASLLFAGCAPVRTQPAAAPAALSCPEPLQPYLRTILYTADFSGPAWDQFLTEVIAQHFPAGGSITSGPGWWRRPDGTIARGNGKQINVLVPATQTEAQIESARGSDPGAPARHPARTASSTVTHQRCRIIRCISCMCAVTLLGTAST